MTDIPKEEIPTIDISPWILSGSSEESKQKVVDEVQYAATNYGFFQIVGHGVDAETRQQLFDVMARFFALPLEERMKVGIKNCMGQAFRGYEPPLFQTRREGLLPDTKETFVVGREVPAEHPDAGTFLVGPNLWPNALADSEFKQPVMEYQSKMVHLSTILLEILRRGLPKSWNCSDDVFKVLLKEPCIPMRMLHYAPQEHTIDNQFGVADHTDFGCVTILLQQLDTKGLEVWSPPNQSWIPVPPKKDAYVINIGDTMDRYTGGYYLSARHRVLTTNVDRYSVAFFFNGDLKLNTPMLDGSGGQIILGEQIQQRAAGTFSGDTLKGNRVKAAA